jgi:predicted Zn finger-like uncharacterized protein
VRYLIVTCEECKTSFQLDESRIPASGAQVRCSRCKHAFFLPHPSASASEAAHAVAEEAALDATPGVPKAAGEAEEEEWQFSEEVRVEGDDGLDTAEGLDADALLADATPEPAISDGDGEDETEVVDARGESSGLELESDPTADDRDESSFGSVDDFSSLTEADDVAPVDLDDAGPELERPAPDLASAGSYSAAGSTDDLGDPESWDLVGSDIGAGTRPTTGGFGGGLGAELPAADFAFGAEADDDLYEASSGARSLVLRGMAGAGSAIGWCATLALVAGVLFVGARAAWQDLQPSPQTVAAAGLEAETSRIRWLETRRAGFAMVIEGQLRNVAGRALRPALVQLSLLDADGERLAAEPIPAGMPLDEETLREAPRATLQSTIADAALRLREAPLAAGEARPFTAIALEDDLPRGAQRLLLEIVDAPEVGPRLTEETPPAAGVEGSASPGDQLVDEESDFSP